MLSQRSGSKFGRLLTFNNSRTGVGMMAGWLKSEKSVPAPIGR